MALVSKAFGDIITFTRASTATYFDSAGVLQSAAIDVPRFDYDPSTLAARGFLIEEARTNFALQSQALNSGDQGGSTGWYVITRASISADIATAPDGTLTADKIVEDTSTGSHIAANRTTAGSTTNTNPITVTAFVKASGRTVVSIQLVEGGTYLRSAQVFFDLTAVTPTTPSTTGGASAALASIVPVGNGWYRCTLTATLGGTDTRVEARFYPSINTTTVSYTGDGTSGILLWGAQIEAGAFPTSYIPTTTTALTRAADEASVNTLNPWYNASEGTLFVEGTVGYTVPGSKFAILASLNDGTGNNRIDVGYLTASAAAFEVAVGGVIQAGMYPLNTSATRKVAGAYKLDDFAVSVNGSSPQTDTTGTVPIVDRLRLGDRTGLAGNILSGWLRRVSYYPRKLSSAELQAITA